MIQDSTKYDSLNARPLPKWLTDQRDGLNAYQPVRPVMKEDRSLEISLVATGIFILFILGILTIYILKRKKKANL